MSYSVDEAVFRLLSTHDGTAALVSSRVYPVKLPQDPTYPALTFFPVSGLRHSVMGNDTGIVEKRFQVSAWSDSYSGLNAVAEQVRDCMQRFRGHVTSTSDRDATLLIWSGDDVEILDIFMEGDGPVIWEEDVNVFQHISDFNVIYRETV